MAFVSKVYAKPKLKACLSAVHKGFEAWQCCKNLCSLPNKQKNPKGEKKESKSVWSSKLKNNSKKTTLNKYNNM